MHMNVLVNNYFRWINQAVQKLLDSHHSPACMHNYTLHGCVMVICTSL